MSAFFICRGETPIPEHKDITDPNIHETKGAAAAVAGQLLTATGSGTATFQTPAFSLVKVGWYDYNDLATQTTPIALSVAGTKYDLTNDKLGPNTNIGFGLSGVTDIWNSGTNRFDFTGLTIGDTVDMRTDVLYTTTAVNTAVSLELELGTGTGSAFAVPFAIQQNFKTAGTYQIVINRSFYIGSSLVKDNPARLRIFADTTGSSVKVNGWFTRILKRQ